MGPRFLEIELTGRCSMGCKHCYGDFPFTKDLPAAKVKDVIDQSHEDFDCLIFSGGEPFLHPDLIELVHDADRKGFSVHITTSGFGVTKQKIKSLPDNAVLVFGIDGIGEVHDRYREKPGAYAHLLEIMAYCQDRPKEIITTLWRGSLGQLEEIISMAEKCGAALHLNAVIPMGRARNHPEILLTREGNESVYQFLKERKKKFAHVFTDLYKITERDMRKGIDLFCKKRYAIDPQGNVHPCEFLRTISFGNVFNQDFSVIIKEAKETPFIHAREQGFKGQVRLGRANPFDYHTEICHVLADKLKDG